MDSKNMTKGDMFTAVVTVIVVLFIILQFFR